MNQAKALKLCLSVGLSVSIMPATASDWVNGDTTMFRMQPNRPKTVAQPATPSPNGPAEQGALPVRDPGMSGAPSDQRGAQALEGNVDQNLYHGFYSNPEVFTIRAPVPLIPPQERIVAPKTFQGWLQKSQGDLGVHSKAEVINVKGQWDDSSHALHNFGIPCTKISPRKLSDEALAGAKVLVVDCAGELQPDELRVVARFVHNGGYLITTDWALDGCLARAIPGYVMWNSGYSPSEIVDAHVMTPGNQLVKSCASKAYWKLDSKCETVKVMRPDQVTVLVRSRVLMRDDPDQSGVLALTFNYGKGKVLHLVGHFDSNSDRAFNNALPDPAPGMGISLRQGIAANFVAEGLKRGADQPSAAPSAEAK